MFYKKRFYTLLHEFNLLRIAHAKLVIENSLLRLGGHIAENFGKRQQVDIGFTEEDFRDIIKLCHPDKHGGSQLSQRVTTKLLLMRKQKR